MTHASEAMAAAAPPRGSAREHIMLRAKRLFAERGYDGVSISDIASETGVSKANIFHHFESKEGLYLAIIAAVVAALPDPAPLVAGDGSVVSRFQDMAATELREAGKDEMGVRLILREVISGNPKRGRKLAKQVFAGSFTRAVELIRAQQEAGAFRADVDPVLAATVLRSATAFFILGRDVLRHLPGADFADEPERYAREAMELMLRGLAAVPANDAKER